MPKLSVTTEATRIMQAMNALQMIARGVPKETACAEVGLSVWQYDSWIANGKEVLETFQNAVVEAERIRMADITNAQAILLNQLVVKMSNPEADPDMQLKTLKYLDKLRNDLEVKHGVHTQTDKAQDYILSGPSTRQEESQMAVAHEMSRSTVNVKANPDGSIDLSIPAPTKVIDLLPALANDLTQEEDDSPSHEEVSE